jgi:hypothetical protein
MVHSPGTNPKKNRYDDGASDKRGIARFADMSRRIRSGGTAEGVMCHVLASGFGF